MGIVQPYHCHCIYLNTAHPKLLGQLYQGNVAGSGREQTVMMNHPPWSFMGQFPLWGQWFENSPRNRTMDAPIHGSTVHLEWMKTPFISDSERGDLLSSGDSEGSEASPPPANWTKSCQKSLWSTRNESGS